MAERVVKVRLSAEVQEYQRRMQEAAEATRKVKEETDAVAKRKQAWQDLGRGLMVVGGAMTALTAAVAATGISYNTLQQTSRAALTTLLGSAEAANAQMDKLDAFARTSPFSKAVFIQAQQQLLGFGMAAEKVVPTLDAIQNAVAATGGSNQDIAELVRIIAQLEGGVKISAETFNQFGTRGVDAAGIIGEAMGKTGAQIREEVTAGTLDASAAVDALVSGMAKRFDGAAANVKQTFGGAMDRVSAAWRDFSAELMKPLVDPNGGGALVDLLNWTADVMRAFQALPEPIKLTSGAIFGVLGAVALLSGAIIKLTPKISAAWKAFQTLGGTMRGIGIAGGIAAGALGVLVAVLAAVSAAQAAAAQKAQAYADAIRQGGAAAEDAVVAALALEKSLLWMNFGSAFDNAEKLGIGLDLVKDAAMGSASAMAEFDEIIRVATGGGDAAREMADRLGISQMDLAQSAATLAESVESEREALERAGVILKQTEGATNDAADASRSATDAYLSEADAVKGLRDELTSLIDRINEANDVGQDAITKNARWQEALAGLNSQVEKNGTSLDQSTASGSANAAALADLASKALEAAAAQFEQDQATMSADEATKKYIDTLEAQRQAFFDAAVEAGYNADEVAALADQIFNLPDEKEINVLLKAAEAQRQLEIIEAGLNGLHDRTVRVTIQTSGTNTITGLAEGGYFSGKVKAFADSGFEPGIYAHRPAGIHKFAEEYDEAYISMDPRRWERSRQVWVQAGQRMGFQQHSAPASPVSLEGLSITGRLEIGGDGLAHLIDGRIVRALPSEGAVHSRYGAR